MADGFGDRDPLMKHTDDRDEIPMQTRITKMNKPPERGSDTAETSFIEDDTGSRTTFDFLKIQVANETLSQKYPKYGKDGKILSLELSKTKYPGKVVVIGPRGGETLLFKADNQTIKPKLPKSETLGPERQVLIQQKDEEIQEIDKNIREEQEIANNENEESAVRERAREKIQEKTEHRNALVNERERLKEGLSLRERIKDIFKKIRLHCYSRFACRWHNDWRYY